MQLSAVRAALCSQMLSELATLSALLLTLWMGLSLSAKQEEREARQAWWGGGQTLLEDGFTCVV